VVDVVGNGSTTVVAVNDNNDNDKRLGLTAQADQPDHKRYSTLKITRSSADADNRLDAFSGQSRSTNMVPFHM